MINMRAIRRTTTTETCDLTINQNYGTGRSVNVGFLTTKGEISSILAREDHFSADHGFQRNCSDPKRQFG